MPDGTKPLPEPDIRLRRISQEMNQPSVTKVNLKIIYPNFHLNLPGANELKAISSLKFLTPNYSFFFFFLQKLNHTEIGSFFHNDSIIDVGDMCNSMRKYWYITQCAVKLEFWVLYY